MSFIYLSLQALKFSIHCTPLCPKSGLSLSSPFLPKFSLSLSVPPSLSLTVREYQISTQIHGRGQAGLVALSTLPHHIITADSRASKHTIHTQTCITCTCTWSYSPHGSYSMHIPATANHQVSSHLTTLLSCMFEIR